MNATVVKASKFVAVRSVDSRPILNALQNALTKEGGSLEELQKVTGAIATIMPQLHSRLAKAELPECDVETFDAKLKEHDASIKAIETEADAASADLKKQLDAINVKIEEARRPFTERSARVLVERAVVSEARVKALEPQKVALDTLLEDLKKLGDANIIETMLEITAPCMIQSPRQVPTGTGRGRAGANVCTITKDGKSRDFPSVNAARRAVYSEKHGEEPKHQANANSCISFCEKAGYTVELS